MRYNASHMSLAVVALVLSGCGTLAPDYERPRIPVANTWANQTSAETSSQLLGDAATSWQQMFKDSQLRALINQALENNRDLRLAVLNVERSRAQYQIQRSELFPAIGAGLSGNSGRTPASISNTGDAYTSHVYQAGVGLTSWELDAFGRVRSLKEQALQEYLATAATQRGIRIGVIAQVATAYLQLAADSEQLDIARNTLKGRKQFYDLQNELAQKGSSSELEVSQAEAELELAKDQVFELESVYAIDKSALELIVGTSLPETFKTQASIEAAVSVTDIPSGLPSDLLQNRPDILAAEYRLIGANANIGAARAAFFPSITLTGGVGTASDSLGSLFSGANRAWSFAPQVTVPIFSGGRLKAGLEVSEANREIAVASYERSIQVAFKEVADALAVRSRIDLRLSAQRQRVAAASQAYLLANKRYDSGVASYLEVLEVQRTLYAAQQSLVNTRLMKEANLVTLFKVVGGVVSETPKSQSSSEPPVLTKHS